VINQAIEYQPFLESFKTTKMFILGGFSTTFSSAVFAYMSHTNVLDVFKELKEPSVKKMETIVRWTILFVLITYVIVGMIGYATFSSNLNILNNVDISNGVILIAYGYTLEGIRRTYPVAVIICIVSVCMSLIIAQPFNIKPAKDGLTNLFKPHSNASRDRSNESGLQRFINVSSNKDKSRFLLNNTFSYIIFCSLRSFIFRECTNDYEYFRSKLLFLNLLYFSVNVLP